jgi:hypothetical protein
MGFTLPPEFDPDREAASIPAGVLYCYGRPCRCAAGEQFAQEQLEWNKPVMPYRPPVTSSNRATRFQNPAKWDPPAWSDPPAVKPKRITIHLITQEEIDSIKTQQEADRKERQP